MVFIVTINKYGDRPNRMWMELYGLSTDIKPVEKMGTIGIGNASTFYEMDSRKSFMYDEENHKWWPM